MQMNPSFHALRVGLWASLAVLVWLVLPDRYLGPYKAWNPHAIMEFVIAIFAISLLGRLAIHLLGAHYGLLLSGLMGGFVSSTATIHTMGTIARSQPSWAERAALAGVLSNLATLLQLLVLLKLLAPALLDVFIQPVCFGMGGMCGYAAWVLLSNAGFKTDYVAAEEAVPFDWKSLLSLTAMVCGVSLAAAGLNSAFGQDGLWLGAGLSGLVDAHAIIPTMAALLTQEKLRPVDALLPLLIALTANTLTKTLLAFQSGGWVYAKNVAIGVWVMAGSVWIGYLSHPFETWGG